MSRDLEHGACELSQVGEVALLTMAEKLYTKHCERLVVGKNSKVSNFKHEPKMAERQVGSQELTVKGGELLYRQLLGVESQWSPGTIQELLQNSTKVGVRGVYGMRDESIRTRVN